MKRLFSLALILILLITACGKEDDASKTSEEQSQTAGIAQTSTSDSAILNPSIEQETEGTVEVIYRNKVF